MKNALGCPNKVVVTVLVISILLVLTTKEASIFQVGKTIVHFIKSTVFFIVPINLLSQDWQFSLLFGHDYQHSPKFHKIEIAGCAFLRLV